MDMQTLSIEGVIAYIVTEERYLSDEDVVAQWI
jgi:hypothetical protein